MSQNPISKQHTLDFHWPTLDPFLFCAHHHDRFPAGNTELGPDASLAGRQMGQDFAYLNGWNMYHGKEVSGFPAHPHRGFETITVVREGLVDHADSLGAAGRYGQGDVQWMTAGKGIQHSEMFPLVNEDKPNPLLLFQIWLNLPAKSKLVEPHFTMFWHKQIPVIEEQGVTTTLIAGELQDVQALAPPPDSWAAEAGNRVRIRLLELQPGAHWDTGDVPAGINRMLYFYEGEAISIAGNEYASSTGLELTGEVSVAVENGNKPARLLFLEGCPIDEPVAHYGPFVMNSREELQQAFTDYQQHGFGGWPWPRTDQTHGRKGRFALHADGKEEQP